jgi:hypothetical protein
MTVVYQIWLKGWLHNELPVEIPEHDPRLSFEDNVKYRIELLNLEDRKVIAIYQKKIEKVEGRVQIFRRLMSRTHTLPEEYEA